jgi:hypothetical protein
MDLTVLLEPKVNLPRLQKVLDELGPHGRKNTIRAWDGNTQRALWRAAKGYRPLTLDDFVPPSVGELVEVIHHGKNTLPAFTHFQKRFCRASKASGVVDKLWGFNRQENEFWTGPGYFVVHKGDADGEIDIDYREIPSAKPEGWPEILPNSARLGRFVYDGMVDVMRGISKHVTIGRARRGESWMDAWFVLCREDPG